MTFRQLFSALFAAGAAVAIVAYATSSKRSVPSSPTATPHHSTVAQAYVPSQPVQAAVSDIPVVAAAAASSPSISESQVISNEEEEVPSAASEVATLTEAAAVDTPMKAPTPAIVEPTVRTTAATTAAEAPAPEVSERPQRASRSSGKRRRSNGTASSKTRIRPQN